MKRLVPKFTVRLLALAIALAFPLGGAVAQSACSTIATGAVLTAAQWNACFSAKQNSLGFTPLNKAGDFMSGKLTTLGTTTVGAGLNLPHGTAPITPANGDMWSTTAGIFARVNGATVGPFVSTGSAPVSSVFGRSGAVVAVTNDYSFSQISGSVAATQLPNPSATTLGGVKSLAAVSNQFLTSIGTNGTPTQAQPSAANLSNGTIGSGAVVLATSPTLTTPVMASIVNTGTLTLPTSTDTLVGKATTDVLTNKTLDSAGTGNVLKVSGVTVSRGQYAGTSTNDSATAGNIGEVVTSTVVTGSAVSLTTDTPVDITTISLTAGDWDVSIIGYFKGTGTTNAKYGQVSISTTLNTIDSAEGKFNSEFLGNTTVFNTVTVVGVALPAFRLSLSGTTTIHFVAQGGFSASTMSAFGIIKATRNR